MLAAAKPEAKLEFHVGWSGWTRPPAMGGVGGLRRANRPAKKGMGVSSWTASANL